jgi:hypothetical protein
MFNLSEQCIWINKLPNTSLGVAPNTPSKGEEVLREILLIVAGTLLGGCLGIFVTCLIQIKKDYKIEGKETDEYEKEKYSEDCQI